MTKKDIRPKGYQYYTNLLDYVGGQDKIFNGELIYPRQLELHLPGNHIESCPMRCTHCQGTLFQKDLGHWEQTGLNLLHNLKGKVPYHIYGGAYTEPITNPYLIAFLSATKLYNNFFGIHTSGVPFWQLQNQIGLLDEIIRLGENKEDYISFSLDAGSQLTHTKNKRTRTDEYDNILNAIKYLSTHKDNKMSIRMCYLLNDFNSTEDELKRVTDFAIENKVDSLRFSIPYAHYKQSFDKVKKYRSKKEVPMEEIYRERISKYISKDKTEMPYIFYMTPTEGYTNIELYDFKQCVYGYYQITYAADGYMYKCSAVAAPDMKHLRLGKITSDIKEFEHMNILNQNAKFNAQEGCFKYGGRCNRMAVECNRKYRDSKS